MIEGVNSAVDNVRKRVQALKDKRAVFLAATGTMVDVSNRVWGRGELTDGSTLSYKEDYELYAYTPPSPRKVTGKGKPYAQWKHPPKGKTGARDIKGGYYKSYQAGFKSQQGRADLPFELTGRFRKSYFGGSSTPAPFQDSDTAVSIRLRGEEASKFEGLTESKGAFLKLTPKEIEEHHKRMFDIYNEP
jgi:hypothetical protein